MKVQLVLGMIFFSLMLMGCKDAKFDINPEDGNSILDNGGEGNLGEDPPSDAIPGIPNNESVADVINREGVRDGNGFVITPVPVISKLCSEREKKQKNIVVRFDPPGKTCEWNENGNLDPINMFLQARIEQNFPLDLPLGSIPCSADLTFEQQDFRYDDQFILNFNNSVVASSMNFSHVLSPGANNLLVYDWNDIAGVRWEPDREETYCPNIPGSLATCSFPGHDEQGDLELRYSDQYIESIVANGIPLAGHYFQMVIIGDDNDFDCEHTGMEFELTVRYVE